MCFFSLLSKWIGCLKIHILGLIDKTKHWIKRLLRLSNIGKVSLDFGVLPRSKGRVKEIVVVYPLRRNITDQQQLIDEELNIHGFRNGKIEKMPHYGDLRIILSKCGRFFNKYDIIFYSHNFTRASLQENALNLWVRIQDKRMFGLMKRIIKDIQSNEHIVWKEPRIPIDANNILLVASGGYIEGELTGESLIRLIKKEIDKVFRQEKINEILIASPQIGHMIENLANKTEKILVLVNHEISDNISENIREIMKNHGEIRAVPKLYHRFIIVGDKLGFIPLSNLTDRGSIGKVSLAVVTRNIDVIKKLKKYFYGLWFRSRDLKKPKKKKVPRDSDIRATLSKDIPSLVRPSVIKSIVSTPRERRRTPRYTEKRKQKQRFGSLRIVLRANDYDIIEITEITRRNCYILFGDDPIMVELKINSCDREKTRNIEIFCGGSSVSKELPPKGQFSHCFKLSEPRDSDIRIIVDKNEVYFICVGILGISIVPHKDCYRPNETVHIELINKRDREYEILLERNGDTYPLCSIPHSENSCSIALPNIDGTWSLYVKDDKNNIYKPPIKIRIKCDDNEKDYLSKQFQIELRKKLKEKFILVQSPNVKKLVRGKGFSCKEIKEAGIRLDLIRRLGLPIDKRRKTCYEHNVKLLKGLKEIMT